MAARHAPEPELLGIVRSRCNVLRDIPHDPANPVGKHRREFWLINSLIYDEDREIFDHLATSVYGLRFVFQVHMEAAARPANRPIAFYVQCRGG